MHRPLFTGSLVLFPPRRHNDVASCTGHARCHALMLLLHRLSVCWHRTKAQHLSYWTLPPGCYTHARTHARTRAVRFETQMQRQCLGKSTLSCNRWTHHLEILESSKVKQKTETQVHPPLVCSCPCLSPVLFIEHVCCLCTSALPSLSPLPCLAQEWAYLVYARTCTSVHGRPCIHTPRVRSVFPRGCTIDICLRMSYLMPGQLGTIIPPENFVRLFPYVLDPPPPLQPVFW